MIESWMWYDADENSTLSVMLDTQAGHLLWYIEAGCACTTADTIQTIADFIARGPAFASLPDDILDEMQACLRHASLMTSSH
jgi:hypothetical protein